MASRARRASRRRRIFACSCWTLPESSSTSRTSSTDGLVVEAYEDSAEGRMEKNDRGRLWVSLITLKPRIDFSGEKRPGPGDLARLHDAAHDLCFIANSIKTEIRVEPNLA